MWMLYLSEFCLCFLAVKTGNSERGKKDFAQSIGYDSGDIVSMWIKGTSLSYKKNFMKLPQNITYPLNGSVVKRMTRA